jgi:hypothetical protein
MKPHPRIRKAIKWGGAVVSVLLLIAWVGGARLCVSVQLRSGTIVSIGSGQVLVIKSSAYLPWQLEGTPKMRMTNVSGSPFHWWTTHTWSPAANVKTTYDGYPLWPIALVCTAIATAAWISDAIIRRRMRAGRCPNCHYDRTGLAAAAVCPECGAAAPV